MNSLLSEDQIMESQTEGDSMPQSGAAEVVDVGLLIETIQNFEYIYNLAHKDYKNSKMKEMAWAEIAQIVNASVEECQKIWKNVRDRFVKEKNKSQSGAGAPEISWPYFSHMSFYGKFTKRRNTYSATPNNKPTSRPSSAGSRPSSSMSVWSSMNVLSPQIVSDDDNELNTPTATEDITVKRKTPKKQDEVKEVLQSAKEMMTFVREQASSSSTIKNANKRFAEYAFASLEEMDTTEAQEKRKKMLEVLESKFMCFFFVNLC